MKAKLLLVIILCAFWLAISGVNGFLHMPIRSLVAIILCIYITVKCGLLPKKISFSFKAVSYFLWLLKEIFFSSMKIVQYAWGGEENYSPDVKWIVANQKNELGMVVYANSITLTPGTVSIRINQHDILVHALDHSSLEDLIPDQYMDKKIQGIMR